MKLVLQIALGVFLGSTSSFLVQDAWQEYKLDLAKAQTEQALAEQERVMQEQAKVLQSILDQGGQGKPAALIPPAGFMPDDAQTGVGGERP